MKKFLRLSQIFAISIVMSTGLFSQILLQEDFDYPAGSNLKDNSWTVNTPIPTGPVLTILGGSLTYPGYFGSGVGNSAKLVGNGNSTTASNGEDLYKAFSSERASGTVYVTFLLNVAAVPSASDYFFHLSPAAPSGKYQGRLFIKPSGAGYQLGISKNSSTQWAPSIYSANTTYLILLKYVIVGDVSGGDDYCELYINPALTPVEPTVYDAKSIDVVAGTDWPIGSVMMRQGGVLYDYIQIDGIHASLSWSDLALPVELNSFTARATAKGAMLTWSTATEVNNRGFEVERRAVVSGGSDAWQQVGFVQGAGTSNAAHSYSYADPVSAGKYAYRLKQVDNDGAFKYYGEVEAEVGSVREFKLYGNYPNPFNPSTAIRFTVAQDGKSQVKIFNALGQEVATIFNELTVAGTMYEARFDASALPSGLYFARLISNNTNAVVKMMLTK